MKHSKLIGALLLSALIAYSGPANSGVFLGDSSGGLYDYDVGTNTSTLIGNMGVTMTDIALDPITGQLFGISFNQFYSINTSTGAATAIGGLGRSDANALAFDSYGNLFLAGFGSSILSSVNLATGATSTIGDIGHASSGDLAFDDDGNLFLSSATGTDSLVSVNPGTGAGTLIGGIGFAGVFGLDFVGSTLYGFTTNGITITINTATGAGTFFATNTISTFGAAGEEVPLPEPASLVIFGIGLVGVGFVRRRRIA